MAAAVLCGLLLAATPSSVTAVSEGRQNLPALQRPRAARMWMPWAHAYCTHAIAAATAVHPALMLPPHTYMLSPPQAQCGSSKDPQTTRA